MPDDPEPSNEERDEEGLQVVGERLPPPEEVRDRKIAVAAVITAIGAATFGLGLLLGAPRVVYGSGLAIGLLALAVGFHTYFAKIYPAIEAVEPRPGPDTDDQEVLPDEVAEPRRRSLMGWLLAGAAGLMGLSFLAPVSSLGPRAGNALRQTKWREGTRLVTTEGRPLRPGDIEPGSLVTAWPEHAIEHERSAVVVLRLRSGDPQAPTNAAWVVDRTLLAYSKICTHAGCPVGLFRESDDALFCPCHLATFDAAQAAEPTFGPAPRRLPQLPLSRNDADELVALGDFIEPIGPAYGWMQQVREDRRG